MKKTKLTALLLTLLLLAGCTPADVPDAQTGDTTVSQEAPETTATSVSEIRLIADGKSDYTIIRPDVSSGTVIDALQLLRESVKEKTGVNMTVKTDWLNNKKNEQPSVREILIGETSREESIAARAKVKDDYDFIIEVVGEKLVIVGGCDTATLCATEHFVDNMLTAECVYSTELVYNGRCPEEFLKKLTQFPTVDGESGRSVEELYDGVISTHISLSADSKYGQQELTVIEFDPKQSDLYFDVTMGGTYATTLKTVAATVDKFNADNGQGKTAIAAVNGDLWMVTYAHARVEGKGTVYNGASDPVVTASMNIPRGFNIYNGEIITSAHMQQETPFEGQFYAFGITDDGTALLGNPQVGIAIKNTTQSTSTSADGLNRLPANNALVMYTDVLKNNNSLSDAYEVAVDCSYDYTVCHGAVITGKVAQIAKPGETKPSLGQNRIILTARGTRIERLEGYKVGDTVEISVTLTDNMGNTAQWQTMKNAVGGHIPVIIKGKSQGSGDNSKYPMTVLGIKSNGNVIMMTNDGRQTGYSIGLKISDLDELCADIGVETAFLLDGGGSATMVQLLNGSYKLVNRPSDKKSDGSYGSPRTVVNSVILSYGPKKN